MVTLVGRLRADSSRRGRRSFQLGSSAAR